MSTGAASPTPDRRRGTVAGVVSIDDVATMASELPDVTEVERYATRAWLVAGKVFAWERAFSKADLRRFGHAPPPDGPILAVRASPAPVTSRSGAAHATPLQRRCSPCR
jgi:hypothetical protein